MNIDSLDLDLVYDTYLLQVGVRFRNITIPQGATITNAFIQFQADETNTGAVDLTIYGHDTANAPVFTLTAYDVSSRTKTTASASWNSIPDWTAGERGTNQKTPDLKSIVQEIVNIGTWASGNSMAFIVTGSSTTTTRTAVAGGVAGAARLHIEYTTGGSSVATWAANEDIKLTDLAKGTPKRVRLEVSNEGGVSSGGVTYQLQVAQTDTCSSGTYSTVPTDASGHWQIVDSSYFTDGDATFNAASGLTDEATTFVAGQLKDAGNTTSSITLAGDTFTEIEFAVQATTNATDGANYCFRLYKSSGGAPLNTYDKYAEATLATGGGDTSPPTPNPMTFASAPANDSATQISMTATTGSDATPPVEYLFTNNNSTCGADAGSNGTSSSWQSSTSYSDTGLDPNKCYGYTVTARDSVTPTPNTGTASGISITYTSANTPGTPTLSGATLTTLNLTNAQNGNPSSNPTTSFTVQVVTTSPTDPTWLNQWVDGSGNPSATAVWLTDAELDALVLQGLTFSTTYGVKVKAKNQENDETSLSAEGQGTTLGPVTVYRSVGTNGGTLYNTGTASISNGSTAVTFSGGASLPEPDAVGAVGPGDVLVVGGETFYIKSRDDATHVTVQTAATGDRSGAYTITRAYTLLSAWENDRDGDIVVRNTIEVAVCYKDGPMNDSLNIAAWTTGPNNYVMIWVPPGQRHTGTKGTGFVLQPNVSNPPWTNLMQIGEDYVRVEGVEIDGSLVTNVVNIVGMNTLGASAVSDVRIDKCLIHDLTSTASTALASVWGIRLQAGSARLTNTIIYNIKASSAGGTNNAARGIDITAPGTTNYVYNNTVYNVMTTVATLSSDYGIHHNSTGTTIATNNYAGGTSGPGVADDFHVTSGTMTQSYNVSEDSTASGEGSQTLKAPVDQFVSIGAGSENLHLKSGAACINAGTDLSGTFTDDTDSETRPTGAGTWDVGADESFAVTRYRSVGTNGGTLYNTGTASISNGSTTVTFSGGASLPQPDAVGAVGEGDVLVVGGETFYIKSRTDATHVTVQTAATGNRSGAYTITRAYTTLSVWEGARDGDLVASNAIEVAVCYKDGPMNDIVNITDWTTGPNNYIMIWVPPGQRHTGTKGTGFVVKPTTSAPGTWYYLFTIREDYVRIEGVEMDGSSVTNGQTLAGIKTYATASDIRIDKCLIHDFTNTVYAGVVSVDGISHTNGSIRVTNTIIYNMKTTNGDVIGASGITITAASSTNYLYNNTIYNITDTFAHYNQFGINNSNATSTTTATNNYVGGVHAQNPGVAYDFYSSGGTMTQSYNVSEDSTASGQGSLTLKAPVDQFVSITSGSEDLHLKSGAACINAGTDLSGTFTDDIDGETRPTGANTWDVGADEDGGDATVIRLSSFTATGEGSVVHVQWETKTEISNLGFNLYRSTEKEGTYTKLNSSIIPGLISSVTGKKYSFTDAGVSRGTLYYYSSKTSTSRVRRRCMALSVSIGTGMASPTISTRHQVFLIR